MQEKPAVGASNRGQHRTKNEALIFTSFPAETSLAAGQHTQATGRSAWQHGGTDLTLTLHDPAQAGETGEEGDKTVYLDRNTHS